MININDKAPLLDIVRNQLLQDANDIKSAAERKGRTLLKIEFDRESQAAMQNFELGCWLYHYKPLISLEGITGFEARVDCAMRLMLSGVNYPGYDFYTVFDFGDRDFSDLFEMGDGDAVLHALRESIPNDPSGRLKQGFVEFGWSLENEITAEIPSNIGLSKSESLHAIQNALKHRFTTVIDRGPEYIRKISYEGPILMDTEHHVAQNIGRSVAIYPKDILSQDVSAGSSIRVDFYFGSNVGHVSVLNEKAPELGR